MSDPIERPEQNRNTVHVINVGVNVAPDPAIEPRPDILHLETHYFRPEFELGYYARIMNPHGYLQGGPRVGLRYAYTGGASANLGAHAHEVDLFLGWQQNIAASAFLGVTADIIVGRSQWNFGNRANSPTSSDLNVGGRVEGGLQLCSERTVCPALYAGYFLHFNLLSSDIPDAERYIEHGFFGGIRFHFDTTPSPILTQNAPPALPPECIITSVVSRNEAGQDRVELHWDAFGPTDSSHPYQLVRSSSASSETVNLSDPRQTDLNEPYPQMGATYTLTVAGPGGTIHCSTTVSNQIIPSPPPEPVTCPPIPPPPRLTTDLRYIQAPVVFGNQRTQLVYQTDLIRGRNGPPRHHQLDGVSRYLYEHPDVRLIVHGYANETGPSTLNDELSRQRVLTVVRYLTQRARYPVDPSRLVHGPDTYHGNREGPPDDTVVDRSDERYRMAIFEIVREGGAQ